MSIGPINARLAAEYARRQQVEVEAAGLPSYIAPSAGSVEAALREGFDFLHMNQGTELFAGADRVTIWIAVTPSDLYARQAWGPTGPLRSINGRLHGDFHGGLLRYICESIIIPAGMGDRRFTYDRPRPATALTDLADRIATTAPERTIAKATTTANLALPRLISAGFMAIQ